jgi:hypothetical protein
MTDRWAIFESQFGQKIRASDAEWCRGLSATERAAIVEDLYASVRQAHERAADWALIDDCAWQRTLAERKRFVLALHGPQETRGGRTPVADAR